MPLYQGYIDKLPAGRPFAANSEAQALAELDLLHDGMDCDGQHLTPNGETITAVELLFAVFPNPSPR